MQFWKSALLALLLALTTSGAALGSDPEGDGSNRKVSVADRLWSRAIVAPLDDEEQRLRWCLEAAISSDRGTSTGYKILAYIGYSQLFSACDDATTDSLSAIKMYLRHPEQRDDILSYRDSGDLSDLSIMAFDSLLRDATPEDVSLVVSLYNTGGIDAACLAAASLHASTREVAIQQCFLQSSIECRALLSKELDSLDSDNGFNDYLSSIYYAETTDSERCIVRLNTAVTSSRMHWCRIPIPVHSAVTVPKTTYAEKYGITGKVISHSLLEAFLIRDEAIYSNRSFQTHAFRSLIGTQQANDSERIKSLLHAVGLRMLLDEHAWEHQVVLGMSLCDESRDVLGMLHGGKEFAGVELDYFSKLGHDKELHEFLVSKGTRSASSGHNPRDVEARIYGELGSILRKSATNEFFDELRRGGVVDDAPKSKKD